MSVKHFYLYLFFISALVWSPCYGADPCMIKLDFNNDANNNDANTQVGFTMFTIADSGSEVNGITIDLGGDIQSVRRGTPSGTWHTGTYYPRAGERIYRDFVQGISPSGVTITLWGLGTNRDCNVTIWAFDDLAVGDNRIANWYANGTHILDTNFLGGSVNWPRLELVAPEDLYKWAFSGTATTDELGRIALTSSKDPCSPAGQDFAFVNAIQVEPNGLFVPTRYAQRPVPFDGTEDILVVDVNVVLAWKKSVYAETHDVYLGTDFDDVNDADRSTPLDVLVSQDHPTTTYTTPELDTNTTYYWRIDEVNSAPDYTIFKGEVWSFMTHVPVLIATNPEPLDGAQRMLRDVTLSWEKGEYAEKHDVYIGTSQADVTDANRSNPLGVLVSQDRSTMTCDLPELLDFNTTYYWRIDEVNAAPYYTIFKGNIWSFTTYEPTTTWRVDERFFLSGLLLSVKDPTIVYAGGKWHLFYTYVGDACLYCLGYANATSLAGLKTAAHTSIQDRVPGFAPQVFWYEPQGLWYLTVSGAKFSTNTDINDVNGWTYPQPMGSFGGLDTCCISDGNNMYFFSASDDGDVLRRSTTIEDFPYNWSSPEVVATDVFEAVQVYKSIADGKFYMMVEDLGQGMGRYFELWTADSLGGTWTKVEEQWAHKSKFVYFADHWTDQASHGELLRAGKDEKMEISDINRCQFLIQGVVDGDYGQYSATPYELGIIRQTIGAMGDFDYDYDVDFADFAFLASQWLQPQSPYIPSAYFARPGGDGIVDIQDLALLLDNWLWGT